MLWTIKMLKLIYAHSSGRRRAPAVLRSLAIGYNHILRRSLGTRASAGPMIFQKFSPAEGLQTNPLITNYGLHMSIPKVSRPRAPKAALGDIAAEAEAWLGPGTFSTKNSLSYNFGTFNEIITLFMFKMAHVDHPLLELTQILEAESSFSLGNGKPNPFPLWRAMMVLLASDMFGYTKEMREAPSEVQKATLDRHDRMSKIVEITYITQQIHKRIIDIQEVQPAGSALSKPEYRKLIENMHKANKAATLIGDLLWTQKCVHMAALKCQPVTGLICGFLMDYCESEFIFGVNSVRSNGFSYDAWVQKTQLGIGSLMGNTMSAMLLFSGHDDRTRNVGFKLGSLMGLTYQAYEDIKYFERVEFGDPNWIDVGLLPIVYKIEKEPGLLNKSHARIFESVSGDSEVQAKAKDTFKRLQEETLDYLAQMEPYSASTKSKRILELFIGSLSV